MTLVETARKDCRNWKDEMVGWQVVGANSSIIFGKRSIQLDLKGPFPEASMETLDIDYNGGELGARSDIFTRAFTLGELNRVLCPDGIILVEEESDVV